MKSIQFSILSLCFFLMLMTSCNKDDSAAAMDDWKSENVAYFGGMASTDGYILYTIPETSGGGSYYYTVLFAGDQNSTSPVDNDRVTISYRGTMINGNVFTQTYTSVAMPTDSTATPETVYVNQQVKGFADNLKQMKTGEIRMFVLPQELGYGSAGLTNSVSPYSTTIWLVQLVKVIHTN